jgi:hypothetical protein
LLLLFFFIWGLSLPDREGLVKESYELDNFAILQFILKFFIRHSLRKLLSRTLHPVFVI